MSEQKIVVTYKIDPAHIDGYGHLNNAKYGDYFEIARLELQKQSGLDEASLMKDGIGLWMEETCIRYKSQVVGMEVGIHSRWVYTGGARLKMEHTMFCDDIEVAAKVDTSFFVKFDKENGKPRVIRPPESLVNGLR